MTTVIAVILLCLYLAGVLIAAGDAWIDEHHEREQAAKANLPVLRAGALARASAARHRLGWSFLWPMLLIQAINRLRDEMHPRRTR